MVAQSSKLSPSQPAPSPAIEDCRRRSASGWGGRRGSGRARGTLCFASCASFDAWPFCGMHSHARTLLQRLGGRIGAAAAAVGLVVRAPLLALRWHGAIGRWRCSASTECSARALASTRCKWRVRRRLRRRRWRRSAPAREGRRRGCTRARRGESPRTAWAQPRACQRRWPRPMRQQRRTRWRRRRRRSRWWWWLVAAAAAAPAGLTDAVAGSGQRSS